MILNLHQEYLMSNLVHDYQIHVVRIFLTLGFESFGDKVIYTEPSSLINRLM